MTYKYPNVDLSAADINNPPKPTVISPFMAELVDAVAMKYPQWLIQGWSGHETLNEIGVTKFKVFDNDNPRKEVGTIGLSNRYHRNKGSELVYAISNNRIAMERDRGQTMLTKDVKQAMKTIRQYFMPPPIADRLDELTSRAHDFTCSILSRYNHQVTASRATAYPVIQHFLSSNWESFVATLEPAMKQHVEELMELEHETAGIFNLTNGINNNKLLTVLIDNDKYVVSYAGVISSRTSNELPDEVRRCIGMLKLADVHVVIEGIGMRLPTGFIIMPPENFSLNK